jgi:hypothetical protein
MLQLEVTGIALWLCLALPGSSQGVRMTSQSTCVLFPTLVGNEQDPRLTQKQLYSVNQVLYWKLGYGFVSAMIC